MLPTPSTTIKKEPTSLSVSPAYTPLAHKLNPYPIHERSRSSDTTHPTTAFKPRTRRKSTPARGPSPAFPKSTDIPGIVFKIPFNAQSPSFASTGLSPNFALLSPSLEHEELAYNTGGALGLRSVAGANPSPKVYSKIKLIHNSPPMPNLVQSIRSVSRTRSLSLPSGTSPGVPRVHRIPPAPKLPAPQRFQTDYFPTIVNIPIDQSDIPGTVDTSDTSQQDLLSGECSPLLLDSFLDNPPPRNIHSAFTLSPPSMFSADSPLFSRPKTPPLTASPSRSARNRRNFDKSYTSSTSPYTPNSYTSSRYEESPTKSPVSGKTPSRRSTSFQHTSAPRILFNITSNSFNTKDTPPEYVGRQKTCHSCKSTKSAQSTWRTGWFDNVTLCNQCGLRFNRNGRIYCQHCQYIPTKSEAHGSDPTCKSCMQPMIG